MTQQIKFLLNMGSQVNGLDSTPLSSSKFHQNKVYSAPHR